jgi:hypothetical protein
MINALSFDLEEWYHSELVEGRRSNFSQATEATQPILDLLDRYQTKASFFIVGEVAEQNPDLVRSISQRGHEIGCHTFSHSLLWRLDEGLFRKELVHFHFVIEKILGEIKIKGFRAPCFSLDNKSKWALKVLSDFGYQYDASIFPAKINPLYGIKGAPAQPYRISSINRISPSIIYYWDIKDSYLRWILFKSISSSIYLLGAEKDESKTSISHILSPMGGT